MIVESCLDGTGPPSDDIGRQASGNRDVGVHAVKAHIIPVRYQHPPLP